MVMFFSTTVLALIFTLVVVHVAAAPLQHESYQRRAVDAAAFIHNLGRPDPAPQATPALADRANNPEGFVPYMHYPSQTPEPSNDKRAVNLEGYVPYEQETRSYDNERVPFPRPVPQNQDQTGGSSESSGNGRKRESDPIIENLLRKPVNVVPIVGRAVDPESFDSEGRQPVDVVPLVGRDVDPEVPDDLHRPVDVVPIVGRAVDPEIFDYEERQPVDVVPIVGRDVDPTAADDLHRPVDVVPIVGRAVDVGAFTRLTRPCGPNAQEYDPVQAL